jgi:hypothetical protein
MDWLDSGLLLWSTELMRLFKKENQSSINYGWQQWFIKQRQPMGLCGFEVSTFA